MNAKPNLKSDIPLIEKPEVKPDNPQFSCGPCAKHPGWRPAIFNKALTGRSHRSSDCKAALREVIEKHRKILGIPQDYKVAITPGSNTGAFEMALWSMLGARGVDVMAWENFSKVWATDIIQELQIEDARDFSVEYGDISDLQSVDTDRDVIFAWNGTTSGVCVPDANWIKDDRQGLTFCDATSAVFAYDMPWDKLDVTTWSWQKVLGGEAAHGMLVLSPRAVERLESFKPPRPLPKIFRMTKKGKLNEGLFEGATLNTPSMLAVHDCLDALQWVESIGGVKKTIERTKANAETLDEWVENTPWIDYLATAPEIRSRSSVCLVIKDSWFSQKSHDDQQSFIKQMTGLLAEEKAANDVNSYRTAPPGLRIWCGATVEQSDIKALTPWLDWAYNTLKSA